MRRQTGLRVLVGAIGLATFFCFWMALEWWAGTQLEKTKMQKTMRISTPPFPKMEKGELVLHAENFRIKLQNMAGDSIYDAFYTIDSFNRRVTPVTSGQSGPEQFLVFFGCSYTLGEGVQDNETLPYFSQEASRGRFRSYNYGISGSSPGDSLLRLERIKAGDEEIHEPSGLVVFTFIDDHLNRLIGALSPVGDWASGMNRYIRNAEGRIVNAGPFITSQPWLTRLKIALYQSNVLQFTGVNYPFSVTKEHFEFLADTLLQLRNDSIKRIHARELIVLIYPDSDYGSRLIPLLVARKIPYLDLSKMEVPMIPVDGHPTAEANRRLALELVSKLSDLELKKGQ